MKILISGSTGLIGKALSYYLDKQGHYVYPLFRNPKTDKPNYWFPEEGLIHLDDTLKADAIIHLAGESIADGRWNQKKKSTILNSRVKGTQLLSKAIVKLNYWPKVFISASAIGYYGDTADKIVDESSPKGSGFLSEIADQWEKATRPVEEAGIRTIHCRTGIVLSTNGGALKKMLLPFKMGIGGIVGNGTQYMSWISINDVAKIIETMLNDKTFLGPYNLVSPNPVTNHSFTKSLGQALNRPTFLPLPAFAARIIFGEMADALLLSSSRVKSTRLKSYGYKFIHDDLFTAITHLLKTKS